jgi:hypothetical protein
MEVISNSWLAKLLICIADTTSREWGKYEEMATVRVNGGRGNRT